MTSVRRVPGLTELLEKDLDAICTDLATEFGRLAGKRLLITGGGGFLGYYLVQSALHWNAHARGRARIDVDRVRQLHARRAGVAGGAASRGRTCTLRRHDMIQPLPTDMGHFDWIIHAAGIASPIYYRQKPLEVHRREHQRSAQPARLRGRASAMPSVRSKGSCSIRPARSTATRRPMRSRPRDLSRQRFVHRPARLLRRVEALRRDAVRDLRAAGRHSGARWRGRSTTTVRD